MPDPSSAAPPASPSIPGLSLRPGFAFRAGQLTFLQKLSEAFAQGETSHLGVFVPGYGKTITALASFLVARAHGLAERLVVFVPRGNLRDQYADGAALDALFKNLGAPPLTFCVADSDRVFLKNLRTQILVTTYQYASGPGGHAALKRYCDAGPTMFVFDEVHHLSDDGTWARQLGHFTHTCSVALSGTPLRSDNKTLFGVPFETRVEPGGEVTQYYVALHEVTLRDAHAEGGILKRVAAHVADYRLRLVRGDTGETVELSLSGLREIAENAKAVDAYLARRSLRFHEVYLDALLGPALERLLEKRDALTDALRAEGRPGAPARTHQLLVIAMSNLHAAALLGYVQRRAPHLRSARIGQDLPAADCARDLDRFRAGALDVMVQVDMIGEGTDIKPISVVVKADLVRAVSKTLQQVFRGMRYVDAWPEPANVCDLYAAGDGEVVSTLEWLAKEEQIGVRARAKREGGGAGGGTGEPKSRWELAHVEHHAMKSHALALEAGARNLRVHEVAGPNAVDVSAREKLLRKQCAELASELVHTLAGTPRPASVREVHARAKQVVGGAQATLSLGELERKRRWLERCLGARRLL